MRRALLIAEALVQCRPSMVAAAEAAGRGSGGGAAAALLLSRGAGWRTAAASDPARRHPGSATRAPPGSRSWASTAAAAAASYDAAEASLAPCERGPQAQAANELDRQLAEAAAQGPAAVLQVVEENGEWFTELNVITALWAVASSGSSSMSAEEVVRSRPFQTLVGEQALCAACGCCCCSVCRLASAHPCLAVA